MSKFKVLVPIPIFSEQCPQAKLLLEAHDIEVVQNQYGLPFQLDKYNYLLPEIDAVICGVDIWGPQQMDRLPKLKILSRFGIGVDNFDLSAAKERGIICTNTVGVNTYAVAEFTVTCMLSMLRQLPILNRETKGGNWNKLQGSELTGKTVGFVGFGAIARMVAKLLSGFDVTMIAYDKYPDKEAADALSVQLCSWDELLKCADVVSLHLPALPETYHIINSNSLAQMKKGAYLINTARGAVIDENAAYDALITGKLRAMASDVFEIEPVAKDNCLLALDNFICTPHIAAATEEANLKISLLAANAVIDCLEGRRPKNILT